MLPNRLLTDYAEKFFGFGNWGAKIWFVGIEEAGGWREEDVQGRLDSWIQKSRPELADAPTFYPLCGQNNWHGDGAKPQETWKQLIRMLLVARGKEAGRDAILEYQRDHFGRSGGRECLTELLPLPSPGAATWKYREWSNLPW